MTMYITQTKGLIGSTILKKQDRLLWAAFQQSILPISLQYYPVKTDTPKELSARLDGILSGFNFGDDIIVQLPTMLGQDYEQALLDKINIFRRSSDSKLIIALTYLEENDALAIKKIVHFLNQADVVILPSVELGTMLRKQGLKVTHLVYLNVWDEKKRLSLEKAHFSRQIVTGVQAGIPKRVKFIPSNPTFSYDLYQNGGFALIWPRLRYDSDILDAQTLSCGLPVLIDNQSYLARIVKKAGIGKAFANINSAIEYVKQISPQQYQLLATNAGKFSTFVRNGGFTSYAINQALDLAVQLKLGE